MPKDFCSFFPEKIDDYVLKSCCKLHDEMYVVGGSWRKRKDVDLNFYKCLKHRIPKTLGWKRNIFKAVAWSMYAAVRSFGWCPWSYQWAKRKIKSWRNSA